MIKECTMHKSFIYTWKRIAVVLFGIEFVGWLADGIIWQFWMPIEWFRLFGELFLAWGIVLLFTLGFSYAKECANKNSK